jgi:long-chain acyl-CoA synthetase
MIGVRVVGIYPTNAWPEVEYIVQNSRSRVVIAGDQEQSDKILDALAQGTGLPDLLATFCVDMKGMGAYPARGISSFEELLRIGDEHARRNRDAAAELDRMIEEGSPDDVAVIIYTSGTTGKPKGAMLSHRNLIYGTYAYAEKIGMVGHHFECVSYLPLCHAAERCYSTVMHLCLGGRINFAESVDTVAANLREIAPTFVLGVPRIWEKMQSGFIFRLKDSGRLRRAAFDRCMKWGRRLSDRRIDSKGRPPLLDRALNRLLYWAMFRNVQRHMGLDRSRHRLCGGASVSPETLRFFDILGLPVGQGYGLTEASGLAFAQSDVSYFRTGSSGSAYRGTEWKVAGDGELLLRSLGVFKGYLFNEAATGEILSPDGWLATGDIVETLDGGEIAVVDRKKSIIITSGGKNIAPSEIENALKDSPFIKEAIVVGEGRKFLGAILQIEYEDVGRWAREHDIAYTTFKSLAVLPEVRQLIQGVVDEVNGRFARVENIRRFALLEKELDQDDGELTATQKVRRAMIETKFAREVAYIYGEAAQ